MLLRQPVNNGLSSPVLVQYLVALAMVDAVRSKPGYKVYCIELFIVLLLIFYLGYSSSIEMA
jgi:hypothetical protein